MSNAYLNKVTPDTPVKRAAWLAGFLLVVSSILALCGVQAGLFVLGVMAAFGSVAAILAVLAATISWIVEGDPRFWDVF